MPFMGSILQSNTVIAGTPVELRESYAGNLSFALSGGSFLDGNNCNDNISTRTSTEVLSSIPNGSSVKAAWLYWAGSYNPNTSSGLNTPDSNVTFSSPTGSRNITADAIYTTSWGEDSSDRADPDEAYFNGKADVSDYVTGNGTYSVSNLSVHTGDPQCGFNTIIAGWSLVIVYEEDSEPFRVVNIFDGFTYYYGSQLSLTPDNFTVSSNPTGKHAHITWEGDQNNSGQLRGFSESLKFEGQDLTDPNNPTNNQFNSYSNSLGKTTRGLDIDEYDIDGSYINPGATSATTLYSSGGDMVFLTAEVFSITNIPVADLSVTTSNPTSWLEGSTVTKKFTVSNNGPNDVPINSVEFNTTLPSTLTFNGLQGDSDWSCTQTGQNLSCIYKPKLRAGWTDYLDITFDVANVAGTDVTVLASVNHDNAPYDIFDNQAANDIYQFTTPVENVAVVDLSASSKTYTDVSGDLLLAEDTLRYTITIDDASNLNANGITVTDDLPANIALTPNPYTIISSPVTETFIAGGGINGTGRLSFSGINLAAGATAEIIFEVKVDASAQEGDSLRNVAEITYSTDTWQVDTGDITVTIIKPDLSPSSIEAIDKNGGLLESGDVITVQITLDDLYDTDISTLQTIMHPPAFIDNFSIIDSHTGSDNSNTYIDIQNISFSNSETPTLEFELVMDPATPDGTTFDLSAELSIGADIWTLVASTLTVVNSQPASAGNKQLYLDDNNNFSRTRPTDASTIINDESTMTWELAPALNSDLTFSLTDISVELFFEGNRYFNSGNPRGSSPDIDIELKDNNNLVLASLSVNNFSLRPGRINILENTLTKNPSIASEEITLIAGQFLILEITSADGNSSIQLDRSATLHTFDSTDNSLKADGYSAVILNASTVISIDNIEVWSAPFSDSNTDYIDDSGATLLSKSQADTTLSVRASVSDPFGAFDISTADISIKKADNTNYDFGGSSTASMIAIDDPFNDLSTTSKTFEQTFTLLETGEITGDWIISVTAYEGTEGDVDHNQVSIFKIIPFQPNINLNKSISVLNDPINGNTNPKAIPNAELKYSITAINTGRGYADDGSLTIKDEIPNDAELFIGNINCVNRGPGSGLGPVCYQDGTSPNESGLTYDFISLDDVTDHVQFSQDGSDFTYAPVDTGDGYDDSVRFIRIAPIGNLNASDKSISFEPEFTFDYQIRLK